MTDIVERLQITDAMLRAACDAERAHDNASPCHFCPERCGNEALAAAIRAAVGEAANEIERLRAELKEWQEEPFGGLVRAGVLFMSPERVEEAKARARREGIEAALAAARSVVSPCDDMRRHVAADEIVAAIRALLKEGEQ